MPNWLARAIAEIAGPAVRDQFVRDHLAVMIEEYDRARAEGCSEHEALERSLRRGLDHAM